MDVPAAVVAPFKYRRWLPYWAVLRTDVRQTLRSWVYRLWVVVTILAAGGFLLYRFGVYREAGLTQPAAVHTSDLLRAIALGRTLSWGRRPWLAPRFPRYFRAP